MRSVLTAPSAPTGSGRHGPTAAGYSEDPRHRAPAGGPRPRAGDCDRRSGRESGTGQAGRRGRGTVVSLSIIGACVSQPLARNTNPLQFNPISTANFPEAPTERKPLAKSLGPVAQVVLQY